MKNKLFCGLMVALVAMVALGAGVANAQRIVQVAPGGLGDVLLAGHYDVRDIPTERDTATWQNFFVIQNTSNNWVAAHLRFRAYASSIEVWDHIILLSPYDVFWGYLLRPVGGGVEIGSYDTATLQNSGLPVDADGYWKDTFKTTLLADCGFPAALSELEAGEMEVIGVWQLNSSFHSLQDALTATYAKNSVGSWNFFKGDVALNTPNLKYSDYNVYDIQFVEWGSQSGASPLPYDNPPFPVQHKLTDCDNVLTGSVELGDTVTGQYYSYNLTALENFRTTTDVFFHRDQDPSGVILYPVGLSYTSSPGSDNWCYGAGTDVAYYLNPDWATTHGPTLRDGDSPVDYGTDFNEAWSLFIVENALRTGANWAFYYKDFLSDLDPTIDYTTDAIISFPTKYLHFFFNFAWVNPFLDPGDVVPAVWPFYRDGWFTCGDYWSAVNELRGRLYGFWTEDEYGLRMGQVLIDLTVWDTDQNICTAFQVSPSVWRPDALLNQVNIVRFGKTNGQATAYISICDDFDAGQFRIFDWTMPSDQRGNARRPMGLPFIGGTVRLHNTNGAAQFRATMVPWTYEPVVLQTPAGN